jgi:SPP1 gp7 family putative phage head morphogenesis protein
MSEKLAELHGLIVAFLKRTGYRERQRVRVLAGEAGVRQKLGTSVRGWIQFMRQQAVDLQEPDEEKLLDWKTMETKGGRMLRAAYLDSLKILAERAGVLKQEAAGVLNTQAVTWAELFAARIIKQIIDESKKAVRSIITAGLKQGLSMPAINMQLRPIIGLNDRLAGAVNRYSTELFTRPKWAGLTDEERFSRIERYAQKLQRYRADNIARTETAHAMDEGTLFRYEEFGVKEVEVLAAPGCCPDCAALDGQRYPVAEAHGILPVHNCCRCGWGAES